MKDNMGLKIGLIVAALAVILVGGIITVNVITKSTIDNQIEDGNIEGKCIKDIKQYKEINIKKVVKATIVHSTEAGSFKQYLKDAARIKTLYEDVGNIKIIEKTDIMMTDAGEAYVFEYEDGTEVRFNFEGSIFNYGGERYLTDGLLDSTKYMFVEQ